MAYVATTFVFGETPSASKWNQLGGNDAYFDSLIGTGSAWTSFTPAYTNLTVGNGTNTGFYIKLGKLVIVKTDFKVGTTSSVGTGPTLTLPVTSASQGYVSNISKIGEAIIIDAGTATFGGYAHWTSTTTALLIVWGVGATYLTGTGITASIPMVWTTNDELTLFLIYEAA